jgi:hypothetical protein
MNLRRTATFVVVGGALAAWLAAAATSGTRDNAPPIVIAPAPIDSRGAELANEVQRLRERLHPDATPSKPGRNLFQFSAPKPAAIVPAAVPAPALTEAVTSPPPPELKLSGLAEDPGADGAIIRTAIISTAEHVILAKEGDLVTPRYRVVRISSDVVELVDLGDGSTLRLALKQ